MFSKSLAVGVLAAGCVAAAAGGAYLAVRNNAADPQAVAAIPAAPAAQSAETARPVAETEAVVTSDAQKAEQPTETAAAASERIAPAPAEAKKPAEAVKVEREIRGATAAPVDAGDEPCEPPNASGT